MRNLLAGKPSLQSIIPKDVMTSHRRKICVQFSTGFWQKKTICDTCARRTGMMCQKWKIWTHSDPMWTFWMFANSSANLDKIFWNKFEETLFGWLKWTNILQIFSPSAIWFLRQWVEMNELTWIDMEKQQQNYKIIILITILFLFCCLFTVLQLGESTLLVDSAKWTPVASGVLVHVRVTSLPRPPPTDATAGRLVAKPQDSQRTQRWG
jgi:hypothetical protein